MYITARERRILHLILSPYKDVTIKTLAQNLDVSERTVRRDLIKLEDTLKQYDLMMQHTGDEIIIAGSDAHKLKIISDMDYVEYNRYERMIIILGQLLQANDFIKLYSIAVETNTNISICSKDLETLETYALGLDTVISRRRGLGVQLESTESDIRKVIFRLVKDYLREYYLIPLIENREGDLTSIVPKHMHNYLAKFVDFSDLSTYIEMIEIIFDEEGQYITDENLIDLSLIISIIVKRIDTLHPIVNQMEDLNVTNSIVRKFIDQLKLSEHEANYFANILSKYIQYDLFVNYDFELRASINDLLQDISTQIGFNFSNDYKLYSDLITHIDRRIKEIDDYESEKNPVTEEIIHEYFEFFKILKSAVKTNFEYNFNEIDIGYIMMYFILKIEETQLLYKLKVLVICTGGMGTSKMLVSRIRSQFVNLAPINTSVAKLKEYDLNQFDLVISTVHLDMPSEDYILVSPLLLDSDILIIRKKVRKHLYYKLVNQRDKVEHMALQSYSEDELENVNIALVRLDSIVSDKEKILKDTLNYLFDHHYIRSIDDVYYHIIKREKLGGLGIPETKCVLYHTRNDHITHPVISFVYLEQTKIVKSMTGQDMEADTYLVMLAPEELDDLGLKFFNIISTLLIRDQAFVDLIHMKNMTDIKNYIKRKLKEVIHNE